MEKCYRKKAGIKLSIVDKNRKAYRICCLILVIVWMTVIFCFSAQDAAESSTTSISVSYRMVEATGRLFHFDWQNDKIIQIADAIEETVRKIAHMIEYAVLSIFLAGAMDVGNKSGRLLRYLITILICIIYASTDEIHQLFVPGRHGCAKDVFIDTAGALVALGIIYLVSVKKKKNYI